MSITELKQNFLNYCEKFDNIIIERNKFPFGSDKWKELTCELSCIDEQRKQYSEQFKNGIQEFFKGKTDEEKISIEDIPKQEEDESYNLDNFSV